MITKGEDMSINDLLDAGIKAHENGDLEVARSFYQKALAISPNHLETLYLIGLAEQALRHLDNAVEYLRKATVLDSDKPELQLAFGNVLAADGKLADAIQCYEKACSLSPNYAQAWNNLGNALLNSENPELALEKFQKALTIECDYIDAMVNKGNALQKLRRFHEAEASYRQALELSPNHTDALNNLGVVLRLSGKKEEAERCFKATLTICPDHSGAALNLGGLLKSNGQLNEAEEILTQALAFHPNDAELLYQLAGIHIIQKETSKAIDLLDKTTKIAPQFESAQFLLAALKGETPHDAPASYVRELFDQYSGNFDQHLIEKLEYRTPTLLRQEVEAISGDAPAKFTDGLDLGCGTGVSGQAFQDIVENMIGVDLSPKMLEEAKKKDIYKQLFESDLVGFFTNTSSDFDFFIAADVFVYIGELTSIFSEIKKHSPDAGSTFVFSVEHTEEPDFHLQPSGRYAHSSAYIQALCEKHGLTILSEKIRDLRKDRGEWIKGRLYVCAS